MAALRSFDWESTLAHPIEEVFSWHTRSGAFERLNAPWRPVTVVKSSGSISSGSEVHIRIPLLGGIGIPWKLTHSAYEPPHMFRDEQLQGPFRSWRHTHTFLSQNPRTTTLRDEIEYELPRGAGLCDRLVRLELTRLFAHRHSVLSADLGLHARWQHLPRKTILIAGASGFVGQAVRSFLSTAGHTVMTLVRHPPKVPSERYWDPASGKLDAQIFNGVDVVVNLCGENIASGRWTALKKSQIEESRVRATTLLCTTIASLSKPPEVCISASGIGFYGDTGDEVIDENSAPGSDFLAHVCQVWEGASASLKETSCRDVRLRMGMVLNASGGALKKMLPAFYCGVAGRLGNGAQYVSWISLQDLLGIIEHTIYSPDVRGPINCVSPQPVTNSEFTRSLGKLLRRPTVVPVPECALKIIFGEMSQLFLTSCRAIPVKLQESGYNFVYASLPASLAFEIGL